MVFFQFEYLCCGCTAIINSSLFQCGDFRCQSMTSIDVRIKSIPALKGLTHRVSAQTKRLTNVGLMLVHRLRRWPNIKSTLVQRIAFAVVYCLVARFSHQMSSRPDFLLPAVSSLCLPSLPHLGNNLGGYLFP